MKLRHLRYFTTLAEELHFSKAAEKLFIAQPPLSRQIKQLEDELGVKLFNRNKRNVALTPAGNYLKTQTNNLFYQIDNIKEQIKSIGEGTKGQLKIGYVGAAMHSILPSILQDMKQKFPEIKIYLHELDSEEQRKALLSGQIDVGFVRSAVINDKLLSVQVVEEPFALILPQKHPLALKRNLNLRDLAEDPFISFSKECGLNIFENIQSLCHKAGFTPKISHETSQINTVIRLVESDLGYSIVPLSAAEAYKTSVKVIDLKKFHERAVLYLLFTKQSCKFIHNLISVAKTSKKI